MLFSCVKGESDQVKLDGKKIRGMLPGKKTGKAEKKEKTEIKEKLSRFSRRKKSSRAISTDIPVRTRTSREGADSLAETALRDKMPFDFADITLQSIRDDIRKALAKTLSMNEQDIRYNAHFADDLGGDSLQSLELFSQVESRFHVAIPDEAYYNCACIDDVAELIYAGIQEKRANVASEAEKRDMVSAEQVKGRAGSRKDYRRITRFEESREMEAFARRLQEAEEVSSRLGVSFENPYFIEHDSALRDTSIMEGREVLNFGSYNYLGMSGHPETIRAACEAAEKYGTSASGSRLLAGEKPLFRELEEAIAHWKHTEASVVMVGGHSTNVTVVGNFCNPHDLILYDALSHNSIIQGTVLSRSRSRHFPHNDFQALERILSQYRDRYEKVLVIVEGVYSMDGDISPIPEFVRICKQYGCFLMVDEAHSSCVIGENGNGVDEYFHLAPEDIDIKMGTLSKGLGACGGYIAAKKCLVEYMKYSMPGFVFSVGISPPVAAAALAALHLMAKDNAAVQRLHQNIDCFVREARARKLNTCLAGETAIVPVLVGIDEYGYLLSNLLKKRNVFVPPAVYPAVARNQARLRFCVTSEHKPEQIVTALDTLVGTAAEMNITLPPPAGA